MKLATKGVNQHYNLTQSAACEAPPVASEGLSGGLAEDLEGQKSVQSCTADCLRNETATQNEIGNKKM